MAEKQFLTKKGYDERVARLEELKVVRRKEVAQKLKEAREQGDLSENAEYDAAKDEYVNMIEAGIVDPAKVTRSALQNAASIAAMVLTTETLVADKPAPEGAAPAAPAMGGMPGMM